MKNNRFGKSSDNTAPVFLKFFKSHQLYFILSFFAFFGSVFSASWMNFYSAHAFVSAFEVNQIETNVSQQTYASFLKSKANVFGSKEYVSWKNVVRFLHIQDYQTSFSFFSPTNDDLSFVEGMVSFDGNTIDTYPILDTEDYWNDYSGSSFFTFFKLEKFDQSSNGLFNNPAYDFSGRDGASYISSSIADRMLKTSGLVSYKDLLGRRFQYTIGGKEYSLSINNIYIENKYHGIGLASLFGPVLFTNAPKIVSSYKSTVFVGIANEYAAYDSVNSSISSASLLTNCDSFFRVKEKFQFDVDPNSNQYFSSLLRIENKSSIFSSYPISVIPAFLILVCSFFFCFLFLKLYKEGFSILFLLIISLLFSFGYCLLQWLFGIWEGTMLGFRLFGIAPSAVAFVLPLLALVVVGILCLIRKKKRG